MKTTNNTTVKKTTDKKEVVKASVEKPSYTYKNIESKTVSGKDIASFLKKENGRLSKRMAERKIKVADIVKVSKYVQHQFSGKKNTFQSVKYSFFMKNESKALIHFGKRIK